MVASPEMTGIVMTLIVMVAVKFTGGQVPPGETAVIVYTTFCVGLAKLLVNVCESGIPLPFDSPVTLGLSTTVHEKVVPLGIIVVGGALTGLMEKLVPLQMVCVKFGITIAGITVTVTVNGAPEQPLTVGVTV